MAKAGINDILVAYSVVGESKLERLTRLAQDCLITVSLDSLEVSEGLSDAARRAGCSIQILLEFDVGMRRCGIQTVSEWVKVRYCDAVPRWIPRRPAPASPPPRG